MREKGKHYEIRVFVQAFRRIKWGLSHRNRAKKAVRWAFFTARREADGLFPL